MENKNQTEKQVREYQYTGRYFTKNGEVKEYTRIHKKTILGGHKNKPNAETVELIKTDLSNGMYYKEIALKYNTTVYYVSKIYKEMHN